MTSKKMWRYGAFAALVVVFVAVCAILINAENKRCMAVKIMPQKQYSQLERQIYVDLSDVLLHNDKNAAVDKSTSTVYIAQDITADTNLADLVGTLQLQSNDYTLFFAPDQSFKSLQQAAADGHSFSLLAVNSKNEYVKYNLIFTTLPVVRMEGEFAFVNQDNRDVIQGDITLWIPNDASAGAYTTRTSRLEWHVRGGITANADKKSWKLSFKDSEWENQNIEFMGMSADDDWILNSMTNDDTKIKEKFTMALWNQMAAQTDYNYPMSTGEYAEVVVNGSYKGLYLLQKRIDQKYLQLDPQDVLLKGNMVFTPQTAAEAFEIRYSPHSDADTYMLVEDMIQKKDYSMIAVDNYVDVNLFLRFGSMNDNFNYKNMYYVLKKDGEGHKMVMVPWDTDMSLGVLWTDKFEHNMEKSLAVTYHHHEWNDVKVFNPQLDKNMSLRWAQLRSSVYTEENMLQYIHACQAQLQASGALGRNLAVEPIKYNGKDTVQAMESFISQRLEILDGLYLVQ